MVFKGNKTRKKTYGGSRSPQSSTRRKAATKIQRKARSVQRRKKKSKAATKLQTRGRILRAKRLSRQEKEMDDEIAWVRQSGDTGTNYRNM